MELYVRAIVHACTCTYKVLLSMYMYLGTVLSFELFYFVG